jgi:ABC-type multidrug transport system ATPase subunit
MFRGFTLRECVAYAAWLKDMPAKESRRDVEHALEQVGLVERIDTKFGSLSGGMERRVGIAQALVNSPALLLLDEPTAGLDPAERERLHTVLREVRTTTTVLLTTHLIEDVDAVCDSVLVLKKARAAFRGTPEELRLAGGYSRVIGDEPA